MKKESTTIRVSKETKKKIEEVKGKVSFKKFLAYLVDFFLTKK